MIVYLTICLVGLLSSKLVEEPEIYSFARECGVIIEKGAFSM